MQKKSKMVSFQAKIYNGQHQVWNENFKFNITFENGDSGVGMSKKQTGNWSIGTEYDYEWKRGKFDVEFRGIKDANKPAYVPGQSGGAPTGGKAKTSSYGYKKSPEEQKIIINQVCMIAANMIMNKVQADYAVIYVEFKNWVYNKVFNLSEDPISTQGVLKIACEHTREDMSANTTIEDILVKADKMLKTVKNVTWTNPNSAPQNNSQQSGETLPPQESQQPPQNYNQAPPEEMQTPPDDSTFKI